MKLGMPVMPEWKPYCDAKVEVVFDRQLVGIRIDDNNIVFIVFSYGSMGRGRAMRSMQWGCGMVMVHNISKVAGAVYREVEKVIEFRGLPLIDYYMDLGATAICQGG